MDTGLREQRLSEEMRLALLASIQHNSTVFSAIAAAFSTTWTVFNGGGVAYVFSMMEKDIGGKMLIVHFHSILFVMGMFVLAAVLSSLAMVIGLQAAIGRVNVYHRALVNSIKFEQIPSSTNGYIGVVIMSFSAVASLIGFLTYGYIIYDSRAIIQDEIEKRATIAAPVSSSILSGKSFRLPLDENSTSNYR